MKKIALSFLALFLFVSSYAQLKPINVPEVWENDLYDFPTPGWNLFSRVTYTFNASCLPIEALAEALDFTTGTFENASFLEVEYNSDDLPSESISSNWNSTTNQFDEILRTTYLYSGTVLETIIFAFKVGAVWENSDRTRYTYDSNGLYNEIFSEDWNSTTTNWDPNSKDTYTHNASDLFDVIIYSDWQTNQYVNEERKSYTYVGDDPTIIITDSWNGSTWKLDEKKEYNYDTSNFLIETLFYEWDGSDYELVSREARTNNSDGNPTERIEQNWTGSSWENETRDRRSYPRCALAISEATVVDFKMYPNPASEQIVIALKEQTVATLQIVDSQGKMLYTTQFDSVVHSVPVSELSAGIYFISITTEHGTTTKKMVKR